MSCRNLFSSSLTYPVCIWLRSLHLADCCLSLVLCTRCLHWNGLFVVSDPHKIYLAVQHCCCCHHISEKKPKAEKIKDNKADDITNQINFPLTNVCLGKRYWVYKRLSSISAQRQPGRHFRNKQKQEASN